MRRTRLGRRWLAACASLHAVGRDIEESESAMQFDMATCSWTIVGAIGGAAQLRNRNAADLLLSKMVRTARSSVLGAESTTCRTAPGQIKTDRSDRKRRRPVTH